MEVTMGMAIASTGVIGLPTESSPVIQRARAGNKYFQAAMEHPAEQSPKARKILNITRDLEQIGLSFNRKLQFVVDHESNEISVKVIDRATDKVIKVLPPEELQRLHAKIEETIGFLFDETV
jgi:flagellar protein FlaG